MVDHVVDWLGWKMPPCSMTEAGLLSAVLSHRKVLFAYLADKERLTNLPEVLDRIL